MDIRDGLYCSSLRIELDFLSLPEDSNVPDSKKFFPKSRIRSLFSYDRVVRLLKCSCDQCLAIRNSVSPQSPAYGKLASKVVGDGKPNRSAKRTYILILAILLSIGSPALIIGFLQQDCGDPEIEKDVEKFTSEYIQQTFWPKLRESNLSWSQNLGDKFRWKKHNFVVPIIDHESFSVYSENTILPFIEQRRIGRVDSDGTVFSEGAYGHTFAFRILDEYNAISPQSPGSPPKYARKELRDDDPRLLHYEIQNLNLVKQIEDPHLVRIIKAYKHGTKGNIIFPLAKTNLDSLLRDPSFRAAETLTEGIVWHPFWTQALNIARALHKILDYEIQNPTQGDILYGYHLDLKPTNILVEEPWKYIIADFGQACFKQLDGATSSKVKGFGGTESYAPPEADNLSAEQNRRYDIWSLGCILLEVSAFIVFGHPGVRALDRARVTGSHNGTFTDDRFFEREKGAGHRVKSTITEWVNCLVEVQADIATQNFIRAIIDLIWKMLQPEVLRRANSREVCAELGNILEHRLKPEHNEKNPTTTEIIFDTDEIEIGKPAIKDMQEQWYNTEGYWEQGIFRLTERTDCLCLRIWRQGEWKARPIGPRSQLEVVPQYALPGNELHHYSESSLYLHSVQGLSATRDVHNEKFWSRNMNDILLLQEALLGNKVTFNTKLQSVTPIFSKQDRNLNQGIFGLKSDNGQCGVESVTSLQLWTENVSSRMDTLKNARLRSSNLLLLHYGPQRRRLVLFRSSSILILSLSDNFRLSSSSRNKNSSTPIAVLEPVEKSIRPRIMGFLVEKKQDEHSLGIPLDKKTLEWEEQSASHEFDSIKLVFKSVADLQSFVKAYRTFKYHWSQDQARFNALRFSIGPVLGFERL